MSRTRAYWEQQAVRRIGVDLGGELGTLDLLRRNLHITEAYAEMYLRAPEVYKWAGMAALTSATVGRGMHLMLALRYSGASVLIGLWPREAEVMFRQLCAGNALVFADIYWQHLAYERAGLAEIEAIAASEGLVEQLLDGWRQIDAGRRGGDPELVWRGNTLLLEYEQRQVLQPGVYDTDPALWQRIAGWIPSPIPEQYETFASFSSGSDVGVFAARWRWIVERMLPRWQELSDERRAQVDQRLMRYVTAATWLNALKASPDALAPRLSAWLRLAPSLSAVL
ncbi:MAG: DUF2515 family protein [Chloroflexota bacterium]|nr:MAG: hypothetical protein DIU80_14110 [Chloroflexota bacterium]